jgi:hypothetical protein
LGFPIGYGQPPKVAKKIAQRVIPQFHRHPYTQPLLKTAAAMTPEAFIALWKDNKLTERGGAQAHFDDLCDLLGVAKPRDQHHAGYIFVNN